MSLQQPVVPTRFGFWVVAFIIGLALFLFFFYPNSPQRTSTQQYRHDLSLMAPIPYGAPTETVCGINGRVVGVAPTWHDCQTNQYITSASFYQGDVGVYRGQHVLVRRWNDFPFSPPAMVVSWEFVADAANIH